MKPQQAKKDLIPRSNVRKDPSKAGKRVLLLLGIAILWAGCTTASVQVVRTIPPEITAPGEAFTIVFARKFSLGAQPMEESDITSCVSNSILKTCPKLRFVPTDEFRRAAFPDLAPEAAPTDAEYLTPLLKHPDFRERIASLGIRYLITVSGGTEQEGEGELWGGGGPRAAVLIGLFSWDRKSHLSASILDVRHARSAGEVHASASGRPWLFFVFPSPLILGAPAFTEAKACGELGEAIAKILAGEAPLEPRETVEEINHETEAR